MKLSVLDRRVVKGSKLQLICMVTNVNNIFSLATKIFGLVPTLATKFVYDLDLN